MIRIVLLRLLESYFRHRWLYFIPLIITLSIGGYVVATSPPTYGAGGSLYVDQQNLLASLTSADSGSAWWVTPAQLTTNEMNELLSTRAFVRSVIERTSLEATLSNGPDALDDAIDEVREALSIQVQGENLVGIWSTSEDPDLAYQFAGAFLDAYVQWKINADYQESVVAQNFFAGLIEPYRIEVDAARQSLLDFVNEYPEPTRGDRPPQEQFELERLQTALSQAEERLQASLDNEESARLTQVQSESVTRQTYRVIDQPERPTEANSSLRALVVNLAIFGVVGAILSLAGIVGGALLDRSLRFAIDVRYVLSLPLLAMIGNNPSPPAAAQVVAAVPVEEAEPAGRPDQSLQPQA